MNTYCTYFFNRNESLMFSKPKLKKRRYIFILYARYMNYGILYIVKTMSLFVGLLLSCWFCFFLAFVGRLNGVVSCQIFTWDGIHIISVFLIVQKWGIFSSLFSSHGPDDHQLVIVLVWWGLSLLDSLKARVKFLGKYLWY